MTFPRANATQVKNVCPYYILILFCASSVSTFKSCVHLSFDFISVGTWKSFQCLEYSKNKGTEASQGTRLYRGCVLSDLWCFFSSHHQSWSSLTLAETSTIASHCIDIFLQSFLQSHFPKISVICLEVSILSSPVATISPLNFLKFVTSRLNCQSFHWTCWLVLSLSALVFLSLSLSSLLSSCFPFLFPCQLSLCSTQQIFKHLRRRQFEGFK